MIYSYYIQLVLKLILNLSALDPCIQGGSREAARFYVDNTLLNVRINTSDDYQVIVVNL